MSSRHGEDEYMTSVMLRFLNYESQSLTTCPIPDTPPPTNHDVLNLLKIWKNRMLAPTLRANVLHRKSWIRPC